MEYLLKASGLIIIFYLCYIFILQRETFFNSNRLFLILGLVTSILLPLLTIPIYVEVSSVSLVDFPMSTIATEETQQSYSLLPFFIWIYIVGTILFIARLLIQIVSLLTLIKHGHREMRDGYIYIQTTRDTTPFSFFRWIVYNPEQFNLQELELVLQHEKVHVNQRHSIDTLVMDVISATLWFNPVVWLYGKALKQNLEFIADHHTQNHTNSEVAYQKLLLKTSIPNHNHKLISTFYNSSIQKRILMLHSTKSKFISVWKYTVIAPLLLTFALTFNTVIIAQTSPESSPTIMHEEQNILKFVVTMKTTDAQLESIKNKLAEQGATIKFKNVKRNAKQEITGIKIKIDYNSTRLNHSKKLTEPIAPTEIVMNPETGHIEIREQKVTLSQTFKIVKNDNATKTIDNKDKEDNVLLISEKDIQSSSSLKSKSPLFILDGKEITEDQMNAIDNTTIESVEVLKNEPHTKDYGEKGKNGVIVIKSKEKKVISLDENRPLVIIDGKEVDKTKLDNIDPNTIESMEVIKDASATKTYGNKGKNGVILITLKKN